MRNSTYPIQGQHSAEHEEWNADRLIMGFSKAFDKVGRKHLVEKLKFYSIQGTTNAWIKDFLADRRQVVIADGQKSYKANMMSGVSQG